METIFYPLTSEGITVFQVNVGKLCNQTCGHCHVDAGPSRKESMQKDTMTACLAAIEKTNVPTIDITGGAPEMNPYFKWFVQELKQRKRHVIVRSNLTILTEEGYNALPEFFADNQVEITASLPCYLEHNVDMVRGAGVFRKSIDALKHLNSINYGKVGSGLILNLVYNPAGAFLPPSQNILKADYKKELSERYGIIFNNLYTITNMPIGRFLNKLNATHGYDSYIEELASKYNPDAVEQVMCRYTLSVGWDGTLYDCDFNQMLGLKVNHDAPSDIKGFDFNKLHKRQIVTGIHCYGCTAGFGSSCKGAVVDSVHNAVRDFYGNAAKKPKPELCCPTSYNVDDISHIPEDAIKISYGCGSPVSLADIKSGETLLDLGSGGGIDCFIAAKYVGKEGRVIGIDMTDEMLDKAKRLSSIVAKNLGYDVVEFKKGLLEDIPVPDNTADVVISNCVINLSPDKEKVFQEIYRILKDTGRFCISDIVSDRDVPEEMQADKQLWGECISGALKEDEFISIAEASGFYEINIIKRYLYREVSGIKFYSITVKGYKWLKDRRQRCC